MLSSAIAPQRLKIRLAHIGHQRGRFACFLFFFYLPMTMIWRFGCFPGTPVHAGTGSHISKSRERPPWPGKALEDWARIA